MTRGGRWRPAAAGERSAVAALLALGTILSRLAFRTQFLYHWDSVNFANAMRHFDVLQEHPQPPGYIVYVWLSRLVALFTGDPNEAMVWISVVSSGLAVGYLYMLGATIWGHRTGLVAAALLACSPLFWFYSEIALPHVLDTFLVVIVVLLLYDVASGKHRALFPATIVLAVLGGVRQQTLVFLLPLAVLAGRCVPLGRLVAAGILGVTLCLGWFIPLIQSSGGLSAYVTKLATFGARFQTHTSLLLGAGWPGLAHNVSRLTRYTLYAWHLGMMPVLAAGALRTQRLKRTLPPRQVLFLAVWVLPALTFYLVIHMGQQGLVLPILPVLCLLSALGLDALCARARRADKALAICATPLMLAGAVVFLLLPEYPWGPDSQRLLTRQTLVNSDRYYGDRVAAIRDSWSPSEGLVVARDSAHAAYYLSEYRVVAWDESHPASEWCVEVAPGREPPGSRAWPTTVILFDAGMTWPCDPAQEVEEVSLASGGHLVYATLVQASVPDGAGRGLVTAR